MAIRLLSKGPEDEMGVNRAAWTAVVTAAAVLTGIRAEAADSAAPATTATARRIVVSLADRKLVVLEGERVLARFDVAVGKPSTPSPVGTFTIVNRVTDPTYYHSGRVVAPGPRNPVGTRWMGLSLKGYGIHGTDAPQSIGFARSTGCIRLRNADVERLFEHVRTGDVVELRAARTPDIATLFGDEQADAWAAHYE
jgi:lipoprotein-anchoring transpeptidase ErfK/SrfK